MAASAAATVWRPTLPDNPVRAAAAGKVAASWFWPASQHTFRCCSPTYPTFPAPAC